MYQQMSRCASRSEAVEQLQNVDFHTVKIQRVSSQALAIAAGGPTIASQWIARATLSELQSFPQVYTDRGRPAKRQNGAKHVKLKNFSLFRLLVRFAATRFKTTDVDASNAMCIQVIDYGGAAEHISRM